MQRLTEVSHDRQLRILNRVHPGDWELCCPRCGTRDVPDFTTNDPPFVRAYCRTCDRFLKVTRRMQVAA